MAGDSKGGLIFVSCGQVTDEERRLGSDVCALVRELTPHEPYFADRQSSLEGLTKNILGALDRAIGVIAIMHPRGRVIFTDRGGATHEQTRASVWIEQEIAIAAFITQIAKQPLKVAAYLHTDIKREGMREQLQLNPTPFREDSQVLEHLRSVLVGWKDVPARIAESELDRVRVRVEIHDFSPYNIQLQCTNDSEEQIIIEDIVLESEGIPLTEPLVPATPTEWTLAPHQRRTVVRAFAGRPVTTLINMNSAKGIEFVTDLVIVLRCEIRGRFKEIRPKHRIRVNAPFNVVHILTAAT